MKNYLISLLILLTCVPSQAMLVRAAQPVAKRIISRLFAPKAQKVAQRTLQLPTRTAPQPVLRSAQTKLFKARPNYRSYYKPTWLLPVSAGTLYASTLRNRAYAEPIQPKPWAAVEEQYRAWFKQTEAQYMQELFELCNITEKEWQDYVKRAEDIITYEDKFWIKNSVNLANTNPNMHKKILTILKKHLPEKDIHILEHNEVETMSVTANIIRVNNKNCSSLTSKEFESTVLHEIQHIIHKDHIHSRARKNALFIEKMSLPTKQKEKILAKIKRLQEMRADILGNIALTPEHARSDSKYFCKDSDFEINWFKLQNIDVKDHERYGYETHPLNYTRCIYLDSLYKQMLLTQYPTLHIP